MQGIMSNGTDKSCGVLCVAREDVAFLRAAFTIKQILRNLRESCLSFYFIRA